MLSGVKASGEEWLPNLFLTLKWRDFLKEAWDWLFKCDWIDSWNLLRWDGGQQEGRCQHNLCFMSQETLFLLSAVGFFLIYRDESWKKKRKGKLSFLTCHFFSSSSPRDGNVEIFPKLFLPTEHVFLGGPPFITIHSSAYVLSCLHRADLMHFPGVF